MTGSKIILEKPWHVEFKELLDKAHEEKWPDEKLRPLLDHILSQMRAAFKV